MDLCIRLHLNYIIFIYFFILRKKYCFISHEYKCVSLHEMEACKDNEFMAAFIFKFNNIQRRVVTFTFMSLYLPCPLNRKLVAPQFWSGRFEEEEILCHACKLKPVFSSPQRSQCILLSDASLIYIAQIHKVTSPYSQYRMCRIVGAQN